MSRAELWEGARAPVTLLGGYLGSGKTTLLNALLSRAEKRYAVLVNDIGAVNVDAALIARRDGDTIELTDGCVCCSLVDGFAVAFEKLRERELPPDQVVVELSGVADPARVVPWTGTAGFRIDGVVVVFDADQGPERERDRWSGDTVQRQLRAADLIVLSKCDLVDEARKSSVRSRLGEVASGVPVVESQSGRLPTHWIATSQAGAQRPAGQSPVPHDPAAAHRVLEVKAGRDLSRTTLESWLQSLPASVIRLKGIVSTEEGALLVEGVGHRRQVRALSELSGESPALGRITVVGTRELDPEALPELEPKRTK